MRSLILPLKYKLTESRRDEKDEIRLEEKKLFNCLISFWKYILRLLILKDKILKELKGGEDEKLEENRESYKERFSISIGRGKGKRATSMSILLSMAECFSLIACISSIAYGWEKTVTGVEEDGKTLEVTIVGDGGGMEVTTSLVETKLGKRGLSDLVGGMT
ncbi:hypothetical protein RCL_jg16952.t1 [Rhizophagus clarus]|uniref:Uncharacterized protein n=1 Tax=Rhizophagus clarus TaxID=94130 RepID=A0A8H3L1D5_9GLOM|nr:hypothetical protein RCL_jg16952.t1 [Rhizophagus clarus]